MALGGSTNTVLHLPAIAKEAGVKLALSTYDEIGGKFLTYAAWFQAAAMTWKTWASRRITRSYE